MSFPFLILAGVCVLILSGDIQANANTNTEPLLIMVIYALAGTFFLFGILRAMRTVIR
tara:strand:- start:7256 stop:7429 length:174 start_codon:yes stop_codon:yes gene_type:complete